MELNTTEVKEPPRPAATVVLLRDTPQGMEVFMLKRNVKSDVMGGAYVFPGGKLDKADALLDPAIHLDRTAAELHDALGDPQLAPGAAAALHVAAVREAFEECGVLLAEGMNDALAAQAAAYVAQGHSFNDMLAHFKLRLRTSEMHPWSRWITPKVPSMMTKRFDTRFFAARVPEGLSAVHDDHEAVDSAWLQPRAALEMYWRGDMVLAPPQIMTLAHLARHADTASAIADALSRKPPLIEPEHVAGAADRTIVYPGDARHSVKERALPGPSHLIFRNKRFEPAEGTFEGLFK